MGLVEDDPSVLFNFTDREVKVAKACLQGSDLIEALNMSEGMSSLTSSASLNASVFADNDEQYKSDSMQPFLDYQTKVTGLKLSDLGFDEGRQNTLENYYAEFNTYVHYYHQFPNC